MKLYGEELFTVGILLIIITLLITAAFIGIYTIGASKLKKQLEREYGSKNG